MMAAQAASGRERLFLLDGMGLIYRAFYSFAGSPLINSRGENTGAVYGFVNYLNKVLEVHTPDYIAIVFDTSKPTFRHLAYAEYKATRNKMPEDLAACLPVVKDVVRAYNIPCIELDGFEADDIIGTLAKRAEKENVESYLVTSDKDFMQLVSPIVKIYRPGKSGADDEFLDDKSVIEKFGVPPELVVDILGLIGDSSDNVPGVPGIGPKTATPLIQKFGSIENIYEHIDEIPQKGVREKLITHKELALLSKHLVTIHTEVPVDIDFHTLRAKGKDFPTLISLFTRLEFTSHVRKLKEQFKPMSPHPMPDAAPVPGMALESASAHGQALSGGTKSELRPDEMGEIARSSSSDDPTAASAAVGEAVPGSPDGASIGIPNVVTSLPPEIPLTDITTSEHVYTIIDSDASYLRFLSLMKKSKAFVFDTETTSTNSLRADLVGISFCFQTHTAYYLPVRFPAPPAGKSLFDDEASAVQTGWALETEKIARDMGSIFANPKVKKYGQNLKYDMLVMSRYGIDVRGAEFDTMVASYVLRPDGKHNLDALAREHLGYLMVSFDEMTDNGKKDIRTIPVDVVGNYSAEDADITYQLTDSLYQKLTAAGMKTLCTEIEFPLIEVLTDMEKTGIAIDVPFLHEMSQAMDKQLKVIIGQIYEDAGEEFNINSTQQLAQILFTKLKLTPVRKTKTGYSTDVSVLETLKNEHPIVAHMLEYRQLQKMKSTYVDALPKLIHPDTKRVHTSYNQTIASTGRLSSSEPNLQNIPIRSEMGREIRRAFIPGHPGMTMLSADYSQIELRIMAHISADPALVSAFHAGEDIHSTTAAKIFNVAIADVSKDMRRKAKEVNFGIMYGLGAFGLASRLEIPQSEARDIISKYFERFPNVKKYISETIASAREKGYVEALSGRRRYLPDINSRNNPIKANAERQAINMPIQGTAADMIKRAMIDIYRAFEEKKVKSKMLLQVHDELVFEVYEDELDAVRGIVADKMRNAMTMNVPIEVEIGTGKNWLEAH
ncbi:MAG TPA: DNA polymerase I [Bacteroidota bacterium]|nr:DNA polymerase I [Bacteroidota bacterium]